MKLSNITFKTLIAVFILGALFPNTFLFAETVTSDNFILKGKDGQTTAQLTTGGEGTPGLFFYDDNRKVRISIGLYGDNVPTIVLNDENENASAILRLINNQGDPVLVLKENGQDKLIINENGLPPTSSSKGSVLSLLLAFLAGILGSVVGTSYMQTKRS
jgi:hypothetical protein